MKQTVLRLVLTPEILMKKSLAIKETYHIHDYNTKPSIRAAKG